MPPTFIFKPQSKKVFEGDTARLECQISAIPTPRIYWKRNNEMVQYNTDRIRYPTAQLAVGVLQTATSVCSIRCKWAALCKEQAGSWVCPGVWHRAHGPWAESLALGTQRDRAVPRALSVPAAVEGPWRSTDLGMKCAVWGCTLMPPAWCQDVINGGSDTNAGLMSEQCARIFWGFLSSSACALTLLSLLPLQST